MKHNRTVLRWRMFVPAASLLGPAHHRDIITSLPFFRIMGKYFHFHLFAGHPSILWEKHSELKILYKDWSIVGQNYDHYKTKWDQKEEIQTTVTLLHFLLNGSNIKKGVVALSLNMWTVEPKVPFMPILSETGELKLFLLKGFSKWSCYLWITQTVRCKFDLIIIILVLDAVCVSFAAALVFFIILITAGFYSKHNSSLCHLSLT